MLRRNIAPHVVWEGQKNSVHIAIISQNPEDLLAMTSWRDDIMPNSMQKENVINNTDAYTFTMSFNEIYQIWLWAMVLSLYKVEVFCSPCEGNK